MPVSIFWIPIDFYLSSSHFQFRCPLFFSSHFVLFHFCLSISWFISYYAESVKGERRWRLNVPSVSCNKFLYTVFSLLIATWVCLLLLCLRIFSWWMCWSETSQDGFWLRTDLWPTPIQACLPSLPTTPRPAAGGQVPACLYRQCQSQGHSCECGFGQPLVSSVMANPHSKSQLVTSSRVSHRPPLQHQGGIGWFLSYHVGSGLLATLNRLWVSDVLGEILLRSGGAA